MKKSLLVFIFLVAGFVNSCVSLQDREMSSSDLQLQVLGNVSANFTSFHFLHIQINPIIKKMAYNSLMDEAKKKYASQYGADVLDIKNITIEGDMATSMTIVMLCSFLVLSPIGIICDWQDITAKGTVVVNPNKSNGINETNRNRAINTNSLENAVTKIAETFVSRLPDGSIIAILNISGTTNTGQIIDELEFRLVEKGTNLRIVERRLLAQIRLEQGFQMTGEVSDESAVSIGNMLGANIVITGTITNIGNKQRLTVKALDVKTGQIVAIAREDF